MQHKTGPFAVLVEGQGRLQNKVGSVEWHALCEGSRHLQRQCRGRTGLEPVPDICKGHEAVEQMIAICPTPCDMQAQIDFRRGKARGAVHLGSAVIGNNVKGRGPFRIQHHIETHLEFATDALCFVFLRVE